MNRLILFVLLVAFMGCDDYCGAPTDSNPKVGETWCYDYYKENPFKETEVECSEILAVKNDYVKYKNLVTGKIKSKAIDWSALGFYLEKDDGLALVDAEPYEVLVEAPAYVPEITFHGDDGEVEGKLSWEGRVFKFEGKAEESAKIFFDWLKVNIEQECNHGEK